MKQFVPASDVVGRFEFQGRRMARAAGLCVLVLLGGLGKLFAQAPSNISFTPAFGPIGSIVTVSGNNLSGASLVEIGSTPAIILSATASQIRIFVPSLTATGPIRVTTGAGSGLSSGQFEVLPLTSASLPAQSQSTALTSSPPVSNAQFGTSTDVSANGNLIAVGAPRDNSQAGRVYLFERTACTWSQIAVIEPAIVTGNAQFGSRVRVSADGSVILVGAPNEDGQRGRVYVFRRTGPTSSTWIQEGPIAPETAGTVRFGAGVAISADGTEIMVGGPGDGGTGAVWFYRYDGSTWVLRNKVLPSAEAVATGPDGTRFGTAVAISADGLTAAAGAPLDNGNLGAIWVYQRGPGTWAQQGGKLVPSDGVNTGANGVQFGASLALSARGNTVVVGGPQDELNLGATWIFVRNSGVWSQQAKLKANGTSGLPNQGISVDISADGNAILVGAQSDGTSGAAYTFTRSTGGSTWNQTTNGRLFNTGASGAALMGASVTLSYDGSVAVLGAPQHTAGTQNNAGGAWVFQPQLSVSNISPTQGGAGTVLTITGNNLSAATSVVFPGGGAVTPTIQNSNAITAVVPNGTTTGTLTVNSSCGQSAVTSSFTFLQGPFITSINPTSGGPGTLLVVAGGNFGNLQEVTVGGTSIALASISVTATTLSFQIPTTLTSGTVFVRTLGGSATSAQSFTFQPPPTLSGFFPTQGLPDVEVSLFGSNFLPGTRVFFRGPGGTEVEALPVTIVNSGEVRVRVPATAETGVVRVQTGSGSVSTTSSFTVLLPSAIVNEIQPTAAGAGTELRILGRNLQFNPQVTIGGAPVATGSITVVNNGDELRVVVPAGAGNGSVCVTTDAGGPICIAGFTFIPAPVIGGFSPMTAGEGATLVINGSFLSGATQVTVGGVSLPYTVINSTTITVRLPALSPVNDQVTVRTDGGTAVATGFSFNTVPGSITGFTPTVNGVNQATGLVADLQWITVTGTNIGSAVSATVGGVAATRVVVVNDNTVRIKAGRDFSNGSLDVQFRNGSTRSIAGVLYDPRLPSISSLRNINATVAADFLVVGDGSPLRITGNGLGSVVNANEVTFSANTTAYLASEPPATSIDPVQQSADTLLVTVGTGGPGRVRVRTKYNPTNGARSTLSLQYRDFPTITALSAYTGTEGTLITLFGSNFFANSQVFFGDSVATLVSINPTRTELVARLRGGMSGYARIVATNGNAIHNQDPIGNYFTYTYLPPVINAFSVTARPGNTVTINGSRYYDLRQVRLGGVPVAFTKVSNNQFRFTVPNGLENGPQELCVVTNDPNTGSLLQTCASGFTFQQLQPQITGVNPNPQAQNVPLRITGRRLVNVTAVRFLGVTVPPANVTAFPGDSNQIEVRIPNSGIGLLEVVTPGGTASLSGVRIVPPPAITGFTPGSGSPGTLVTVTGSNFESDISVSIGGAPVARVVSINGARTQMVVEVGLGATGRILAATPGGVDSSAAIFNFSFQVPTISDFVTTQGGQSLIPGETVTINGTNFYGVQTVRMGGVTIPAANYTVLPNKIVVTVDTAASGAIEVTTPGGMASAEGLIFVPRPLVQSVTPNRAGVGRLLTISGAGLDSLRQVFVFGTLIPPRPEGGYAGTFNTLLITLPANLVPAGGQPPLRLVNRAGARDFFGFQFVGEPTITSFDPKEGEPESEVRIFGTNFNATTEVVINGQSTSQFTIVSNNEILAVINRFTSTGAGFIDVQTEGGRARSVDTFRVTGQSARVAVDLQSLFNVMPVPCCPGGEQVPAGSLLVTGRPLLSANIVNIGIYSSQGKLLLTRQVTRERQNVRPIEELFDLSRLPNGFYYVFIRVGRQQAAYPFVKF